MKRTWLWLSTSLAVSSTATNKGVAVVVTGLINNKNSIIRKNTLATKVSSKKMASINFNQLASAWAKEYNFDNSKIKAIGRTLPLLEDSTSVPFVCRYRTDVIQPLTTKDVHQLSEMLQAYNSLHSLRQKILDTVEAGGAYKNNANAITSVDPELKQRVQVSISKSELEDIYAPFKPPSKGSLEERINNEHPKLKPIVEAFWEQQQQEQQSTITTTFVSERQMKPRDAAVTLLANKIASHTATTDALLEYVGRSLTIKTSKAKATTTTSKNKTTTTKKNKDGKNFGEQPNDKKYSTYYDFQKQLQYIRDHQVLAIRRGVDQKAIKMVLEIDGERTESRIRRSLLDAGNQQMKMSSIWKDSIHDAWTRLLRKRITNRLWKDSCDKAERVAVNVFCDNLANALLAPPLSKPTPILALDPGYQAGIKTAMLDKDGQVIDLMTIKFLQQQQRKDAIENLKHLLQTLYSTIDQEGEEEKDDMKKDKATTTKPPLKKKAAKKKQLVTVALGNGHGSQEARDLVQEASDSCGIPINLQLVNEAGASVWSVTDGASREFPNEHPAAVAAVSIGRRYQNPLPELVKIPPRSLGLGMYQHDLSDKELDEKLHITSVHAVAEVGVNGNSCSIEILEKIPGLTTKLAERIVAARPLKGRKDLLDKVSGLGPKTFENCAAFIYLEDGDEPLDTTLVHPESYRLARHLLKKLKWDLKDKSSIIRNLPKSKGERKEKWGTIIDEAATKYKVSVDRVSSVIEHLITSITNPDPRLGGGSSGNLSIVGSACLSASSSSESATNNNNNNNNNIGSIDGCSLLPTHLSTSTKTLSEACPLRGIVATVRNVVDFGAFMDFGGENDGLMHRSKMGKTSLSSLLVGQQMGVDILAVSDNGRVTLALNGLNLNPDPVERKGSKSRSSSNNKRAYSTATIKKPTAKPPAKRRKVTKR